MNIFKNKFIKILIFLIVIMTLAQCKKKSKEDNNIPIFALLALSSLNEVSPGSLDTSFGNSGKVTISLGSSHDYARAMAIQPDGKIVVVGCFSCDSSYSSFAVARFNTNGTLDTSFDSDGIVTTTIGSYDDEAYAVAIQSDGKIVVAGFSNRTSLSSSGDFAVVRYNSNGSLDTSFGNNGKVTTDIRNYKDIATAVAIQSDGKIVVAGYADTGISIIDYDFAIVRYNPNGSLDTSFDSDGIVWVDFGSRHDYARAMTIQSNGKIVMAGCYRCDTTSSYFAVARFNSDGTLDTSFDSDGTVTTAIGSNDDEANAIAIQSDGKIVVAGFSTKSSSSFSGDFAVVRYNSNGSLDTSFGNNGKVITDIRAYHDVANAVAIQSDGKIVVAGYADTSTSTVDYSFTVVRYNSNGSLDTSFDTNGKVWTNFVGNEEDYAYAIAIQSDGKIVVAGYADTSTSIIDYDFALARYNF